MNSTFRTAWMRTAGLAGALVLSLTIAPDLRAQAGDEVDPNELIDPQLFSSLEYRMVGPTRGGRVTAVEGHPAHRATFYMGATGGGVWKTDNYGARWYNISDGYFASPSIGSIEVADSDPSIVYVGTGSDGIRSNVISGRGIYRSDDAGETWRILGLEDSGQIGAVKAHPDDPDLVYAAALGHPFGPNEQRGVFRSRDGGANWEKVLFTSDSVGAIDLEFHPTDPHVIYAAMWRGERKPWTIISGAEEENGIWRTEDGGDSWTRITAGLPEGLTGKIDFSVTPADPDRVYALVEAPEPQEGLYRSDDAGLTWRQVNADERGQLMHRPFYFTNVHADPRDADVVWVSNLLLWKSTDGGGTFQVVSTTHADNHDLWINPDDTRIMVQSNDGGASVTLDGGETWSTIDNQPTAELYQVDVDTRFPYWLYAGQQDNSTIAVPSLPPAESAPGGAESWWKEIGGCETGPVVPKPGDPDIVYANCKGRFGLYDARTGQERQYYVGAVNLYGTNPAELPFRFQRTVPIEVSPHDPNTVYHGSQFVHRTTDGGETWERISPDLTAFDPDRQMVSGGPITRDATGEEHFSTLYVIEASPHDPLEIWAGANDGPVQVTRDGGASWNDVTPPMPPDGRVNAIELSPHDRGRVYVAAYRMLVDDWEPYLFRSTDGGESWERLTDGTNGIPADYPVRVVREDPVRPGLLYAGTEFGMFVSLDDGRHWQTFQQNLPVSPITDIELVRGDLALSTMGRSFWILDDLTPLRAVAGDAADGSAVAAGGFSGSAELIQPSTAYRLRYNRPGGFGPTNPAAPEYPQPGARIDYWLASPSNSVSLEIRNRPGEIVRTIESGSRRLDGSAGLHRFVWDLRSDRAGGGRGFLVPPGDYTLRLTADGTTLERTLTVAIDPRVEASGISVADLEEQFDFNHSVAGLQNRARALAREIEAMLEQLDEGDERSEAQAILSELVDADGSYPEPVLISQIGYLLGMTGRADQRPGADAYERRAELTRWLEQLEIRRNQLRS